MKQFFDALNQAQAKAKDVGSQNAIQDMVREWEGMGQNLVESLRNWVTDIEKREQNLISVTESLEKRSKDLEMREREFEGKKTELALKGEEYGPLLKSFVEEVELREKKLDEQLKSVKEHIDSLEVAHSEVQGLKLLQSEKLKEIEKKEKEVDSISGSLEKRLREVEQREKESDQKLRQLVLKEELLNKKWEEFVEEVNLANEKFREGEKMIKRLDSALGMLEGMKASIDEKFEEIASWEAAAHKALTALVGEAAIIQQHLEIRFEEFEKMLTEFTLSHEDRMQKLGLNDQHPSVIREELLKEIKLVDEKIAGQQKLGDQLLERLEELTAKKLKEMESLQLTLNVTSETFSAQDSDSNGELMDVRLQEHKKRVEEFHLYQAKKETELELTEKKLRLIMEEFIQEVKYREEKFDEQEKLLCGLLSRLELAQSKIEDMNKIVRQRFKEISLKETEFGYVEKKMNELEFKPEKMKEGKKGIKAREDDELSEENTLEREKKVLESEEGSLASQRKELEWKEQNSQVCDLQEKNLNSIREFVSYKLSQPERCCLNGERSVSHFNEHVLKRQQLTDAFDGRSRTELVGFVDLNQAVDLKRLEMIINNIETDSETMADEVFKDLLLSPDPAKLVLNSMEWFCKHRFMEGDMESNVRRTRILLLHQLTKMSPNIHPCVREAAIKLASEWKSNIRTVDENPLWVLEFLHLLAAYNLSSLFDKDELLRFLMVVAQHKETPELCCILDLKDKMHVFVQNLINEKKYLLASTYIYACGLEKVFSQAAVLNYYVRHVKMSAKAKHKNEQNSSEALSKAIFDEIADLRTAIEHIVKYDLESEYLPDTLMGRIEELETDLANLKYGIVSSVSTDMHKWGKVERSSQLQDAANKGKAQQNKDEAAEESFVPVANARLREQGSDEGTSFWWKSQEQQSKTKKRRASHGFHEPLSQEDKGTHLTDVVGHGPVNHWKRSRKRHRRILRDSWNQGTPLEWHRTRH